MDSSKITHTIGAVKPQQSPLRCKTLLAFRRTLFWHLRAIVEARFCIEYEAQMTIASDPSQ